MPPLQNEKEDKKNKCNRLSLTLNMGKKGQDICPV